MKELTYKANDVLKKLFDDAGLILVDFKLEFGLYKGEVVLGDEFSPDGSRLWDKETLEKMDKDRFRQSLGGLIEAYGSRCPPPGCTAGLIFLFIILPCCWHGKTTALIRCALNAHSSAISSRFPVVIFL